MNDFTILHLSDLHINGTGKGLTEKSSVRHKRGIETCGQCNSGHYRRYNR